MGARLLSPDCRRNSAGELAVQLRGIQNKIPRALGVSRGDQSTIANGGLTFLTWVCVELQLNPLWAAQLLLKRFSW